MPTVIVGLGNPGKEYESTFHNAGWRALDALSEKLGKKIKKAECSSLTWAGSVGGEKVVLAKPLTYMNLSGEAVKSLVAKYKAEPIIVYDDVDLPIGTLRARTGGSAGTHNGMRNIVEKLGRSDFCRIRIGIGRGEEELKDYVLSRPSEEASAALAAATSKLADKLAEYLLDGRDFEKLMRELNASAR